MLPRDRLRRNFVRRARFAAIFAVQRFTQNELRIIGKTPIVRLSQDKTLFPFVLNQPDKLLAERAAGVFSPR